MKSSSPFDRRKARKTNDLERKGVGATEKKLRILIVCEGQKTEPNYFEAFKADYRDQLAAVIVKPSRGSAPISNVETAEKLYQDDLASVGGDFALAFDAVHCVFDRDNHPSFDAAIAKVASLYKDKIPIYAIVSYPCFEFWLILHFRYTRKPFAKTSKLSIGDAAKKMLREFPGFAAYKESEPNAYALTKELLRDAIKHSKQAAKEAIDVDQPNPSTRVHELIEVLFKAILKSLLAQFSKEQEERINADLKIALLAKVNAIGLILGIKKTSRF